MASHISHSLFLGFCLLCLLLPSGEAVEEECDRGQCLDGGPEACCHKTNNFGDDEVMNHAGNPTDNQEWKKGGGGGEDGNDPLDPAAATAAPEIRTCTSARRKLGGGTIAAIVLGALAVLGLAAIIVMRLGNSSEQYEQPPAAHPNAAAHFLNKIFTFADGGRGGDGNYSTPSIPTSAELAARAAAAAANPTPASGAGAWAKQYDALTASALAAPGQVYAVPAEATGEVVVCAPTSSAVDAYGGVTYSGTGVQYRPIYATNTDASGEAGTYSGTGVQYRPIYATSANTSGDGGSTTYSAIDSSTAAGGNAAAATTSTPNYAQPLSKEERPKPAVPHAAGSARRPTLRASASPPVQVPALPVRRVTQRSGGAAACNFNANGPTRLAGSHYTSLPPLFAW
eukprot:gene24312-4400_t